MYDTTTSLINCQDDPEAMYPKLGKPSDEEDSPEVAHARAVCRGKLPGMLACPQLSTCLEGALERGEKEGVWGGMTAHELANLKRARIRQSQREQADLTSAA